MTIITMILWILVIYFSYIILGILWSLCEWYTIVSSTYKRYGDAPKPGSMLPDKKAAKKIIISSMLAWPFKLVQFVIFNLTNRLFSLLYEMLFFLYARIVESFFGK